VLLNRFEKAMMNNPVRAAVQRHLEARWLLALGGRMDGGRALEVGCGRGVGTEIILSEFGAGRVDAFDLDPHMVALARRRLARHGDRVRLWAGDATAIDAPDSTYDAAFDFGIIHHVPEWRRAVAELHRVLKPGGRLYAEEVLARFIHHPVWRRLLDHPMDDRFDMDGFCAELREVGFDLTGRRELFGHFGWVVATRR